jgi:c-di-GMP-binding flagellar brake protein YcgR
VKSDKVELDWARVAPHLVLLFLLVFGGAMASWRAWRGDAELGAALVSVAWALYNSIILANAVIVARTHPQQRGSHRLPRAVPCRLFFGGKEAEGATEDLSETGASIRLPRHVLLPKELRLRLESSWGETTELAASLVRNSHCGDGARVALRFANVTEAQRQSLVRELFSAPDSWERERRGRLVIPSLWLMMTAWLRFLKTETAVPRKSLRVRRLMDCELVAEDGVHYGLLRDLSTTGLSLQTEAPVPSRSPVTVRLHPRGDKRSVELQARVVRRQRTRDHGTELLGIQFLEQKDAELAAIL